jgi:hypothetical protein
VTREISLGRRTLLAAAAGAIPASGRATIEAFCRYAHDQGVTQRRMTAEELFPHKVRGMARV